MWGKQKAEVGRAETRPDPCPLSRRELDILRLAAKGLSGREIADVLHLSVKTVESHLQHIYRKLGVRNRVAAVAIAVGECWIEPPEWFRGTRETPDLWGDEEKSGISRVAGGRKCSTIEV